MNLRFQHCTELLDEFGTPIEYASIQHCTKLMVTAHVLIFATSRDPIQATIQSRVHT